MPQQGIVSQKCCDVVQLMDQAAVGSSSGRLMEGVAEPSIAESSGVSERMQASAEAAAASAAKEEQLGALQAQGHMLDARKVGSHIAFFTVTSGVLFDAPGISARSISAIFAVGRIGTHSPGSVLVHLKVSSTAFSGVLAVRSCG